MYVKSFYDTRVHVRINAFGIYLFIFWINRGTVVAICAFYYSLSNTYSIYVPMHFSALQYTPGAHLYGPRTLFCLAIFVMNDVTKIDGTLMSKHQNVITYYIVETKWNGDTIVTRWSVCLVHREDRRLTVS